MHCSSQALRKLLERAEHDFLADMHQLHMILDGERGYIEKYFTFSHCHTDSSPLNPLNQESSRLSGPLQTYTNLERGAQPNSPDRGPWETLFPP